MTIHCFESKHLWDNRLYVAAVAPGEIEAAVCPKGQEELKGASVRSYGKLMGWLLTFIGFATKIKVNDKEFYVNKKSFCKLVARNIEMGDPLPLTEAAKKLHQIFKERLDKGYNEKEIAKMNRKLKSIVSETQDIDKIFIELFDYEKSQLVKAPK